MNLREHRIDDHGVGSARRPERARRGVAPGPATRALDEERRRFDWWGARVDRLLERCRHRRVPRTALQHVEALRHKRDRTGLKLERLARVRAGERPDPRLRRELGDAWRELREAWANAVERLGDTTDS